REAIRRLKARTSLGDLEASDLWQAERRSMAGALRRDDPEEPVRFLSEIKRASPTAGPIRPNADPAEIARTYGDAGAAALSILTEPRWFDGDPSFLARAREAVDLPLLMKDFVLDEWHVAWARSLGADAILLIVAALDPAQLRDLLTAAREVGIETLVETHDERELDRALEAGAEIVGINHRNLQTFAVDLGLSDRLLPRIPAGKVRVAESGIRSRDEVERLEQAGVDALLVGESLMRAEDPGAALRALRGEEPSAR
ncbi:MAG: indole-3-glycerol phosphate synthase TrpC, partial [Candidatus Latescibacteria bacterium]|nr:indole-3-glycerol phosphate synthase TrpC [Candidatus Latescibacterota bacterium]